MTTISQLVRKPTASTIILLGSVGLWYGGCNMENTARKTVAARDSNSHYISSVKAYRAWRLLDSSNQVYAKAIQEGGPLAGDSNSQVPILAKQSARYKQKGDEELAQVPSQTLRDAENADERARGNGFPGMMRVFGFLGAFVSLKIKGEYPGFLMRRFKSFYASYNLDYSKPVPKTTET